MRFFVVAPDRTEHEKKLMELVNFPPYFGVKSHKILELLKQFKKMEINTGKVREFCQSGKVGAM